MNAPTELPLRDIHLPDPVSWWPPALGWWLLAAGLLLLVAGLWLLLRWHLRGRLHRAGRAALAGVFAEHRRHGDGQRLIQALSVLLRRIALSRYPRVQVAALSGSAWLEFLDQTVKGSKYDRGFSQGPGQILAEGPYAPTAEVDSAGLERLCRAWLRRLPRPPRR